MARTDAQLEQDTLRKVTLRLIPMMLLLYVFSMLDRANISAAVLPMQREFPWLTDDVVGWATGIFYVGYISLEIPSNVMMEKLGARIWIARIMITWGILAAGMMFVHTWQQICTVRFLLGLAEAGFFPGMVLYMTYWFPNSIRGRASARFMIAGVVVGVLGNPLGAALLKLHGVWGLHGWQWLFLVEGLPSVLLGFGILGWMTDKPEQAKWLEPEEREWLVRQLAVEQEQRRAHHHMSFLQVFKYRRVLHISALFFLNLFSAAGLGAFTNLILRQRSGWPDGWVLMVSAIPNVFGVVCMLAAAAHSDKTKERRLYIAAGLGLASIGIALVATVRSLPATIIALSVLTAGTSIANGPFWALASGFLSGTAAAGGLAFINSIGNSGSFLGPVIMGQLKKYVHTYEPGVYLVACTMALGALLAYRLPPDPAQEKRAQSEVVGLPSPDVDMVPAEASVVLPAAEG